MKRIIRFKKKILGFEGKIFWWNEAGLRDLNGTESTGNIRELMAVRKRR